MGWCYSYDNTKKQEVERLLRLHDNLLDHSLVGNDLWVLAKWNEGQHISLYMIGYCHETRGYGYKGIDVTSGPYKYTCPKRLVDKMSPLTDENDPSGYGRGWLEEWHKHRAAPKAEKWKVGDKFKWWNGETFEIIARRSSKSFYVHDQYGRQFKISTIRINRGGTKL
jgi:hypothetical protein